MQTCKPNCGCECDYDVKACRDLDRAIAHNEARERIVQQAYDAVHANYEREHSDE